MKEKAAQASGMASGAYDQVTQGGVEPDARKLAQAAYLPKGVTVAPGSPMEAKMPGLMARDVAGAQGYAQGASIGRGAQDIYDQVLSKEPGSMGSMMDTMQNGMPSGAEVGGAVKDIMAQLSQLPSQVQQQIQQAVQSGQVTIEQVASELQKMGGVQAMGQDLQGLLSGSAYADPNQIGIFNKGMSNEAPMMKQGGAPPAAGVDPDRAASEQVIMQKLMSMSPEERNALVQKLQQQAGGMQ